MTDKHSGHGQHQDKAPSRDRAALNRLARAATLHCMTGCGIGELMGLVLGNWYGWGNGQTIVVAVILAFIFGYAMTMIPLVRAGLPMREVLRLGLAADTVSITVMEIVDNAIMLIIPGAMTAGLTSPRFWISFAIAMGIAGLIAYPVNRWLISRGRGHAVVHGHHHH